ncbi:MAG: hypothetical protein E6Q97_17035 [Desulfurellales bacterium]|nr:MAG: hypothetical protein E6Q97_17035 [Desulfurellales bacterium]
MSGNVDNVAVAALGDADKAAADAARALGDKLLAPAEDAAEAPVSAGPSGSEQAASVVTPDDAPAGVGAPKGGVAPGDPEGRPGDGEGGEKHAEPVKAGAAEDKPEDDLEAVLRGRSERVKQRLDARKQLQELEAKVQAAQRAAQELVEKAQKDPLGLLRKAGYTDEAIAKALLGEDSARPPVNDPVAARLEKLEKLLEGRAAEERSAREAAEAAALQQAQAQVKREFVGYVASQQDEFTHLSAYYDDSPEELATRALEVADTYRERTGKETSFEAVARYLENDLRTRYSKVLQRRQPEPPKSAASPSKGQKTLTASDAAPRSSPKDPANMTESEARKEALRLANQFARERR